MTTTQAANQIELKEITLGFVRVSVPFVDSWGTQATIDFRRIGNSLYGGHICAPACRGYLREARKVAKAALRARKQREYAKAGAA